MSVDARAVPCRLERAALQPPLELEEPEPLELELPELDPLVPELEPLAPELEPETPELEPLELPDVPELDPLEPPDDPEPEPEPPEPPCPPDPLGSLTTTGPLPELDPQAIVAATETPTTSDMTMAATFMMYLVLRVLGIMRPSSASQLPQRERRRGRATRGGWHFLRRGETG